MNALSDLDVQNKIVWLHFWRNTENLTNEEVLEWIVKYSAKFREIWDAWNSDISDIIKKLYN